MRILGSGITIECFDIEQPIYLGLNKEFIYNVLMFFVIKITINS